MKYNEMSFGRSEAVFNKLGGMSGIDRFLAGETAIVNVAERPVNLLFEFITSFNAPGTKEFVVKQKYVVDTSENARVRIAWLGENFKKNFWPKVERDIVACELKLSKLLRYQHDLPMSPEQPGTIFGLGGLTKAETTACEFYETLAYKQSVGDFSWTVGYARDQHGVLWALSARWGGGGWSVEAYSPDRPFEWGDGSEFLSR